MRPKEGRRHWRRGFFRETTVWRVEFWVGLGGEMVVLGGFFCQFWCFSGQFGVFFFFFCGAVQMIR